MVSLLRQRVVNLRRQPVVNLNWKWVVNFTVFSTYIPEFSSFRKPFV
ncbi:hypothetical protein AQPE_0400 [Aquipluma nitroreducens]|uniref:Uncharacterized protein n=1 Tax=Aquipluma nitroreducens TaxID=2010828 RepID=A0A5K7S3Y9_9BACT|nr:hypothetical protein AQPE_0400 [Aquipluma nitroreducens]